jgi:hypothetical protein
MFILGHSSRRNGDGSNGSNSKQHGLETRHVSSWWYVFFYLIFIYYTNAHFRSTQCVETAMAATAARARDSTPPHTTNTNTNHQHHHNHQQQHRCWQHQQQRWQQQDGLETSHASISGMFFLSFFPFFTLLMSI